VAVVADVEVETDTIDSFVCTSTGTTLTSDHSLTHPPLDRSTAVHSAGNTDRQSSQQPAPTVPYGSGRATAAKQCLPVEHRAAQQRSSTLRRALAGQRNRQYTPPS